MDFFRNNWKIILIVVVVILIIIGIVLAIIFGPAKKSLTWTDYPNLYWGQTLSSTGGKGSTLLGSASSMTNCRALCTLLCPNAVTYDPSTNNCWSGNGGNPTVTKSGYISSVGS
jgi:cytochrome c biogenesis protein CcdA